MEFSVPQFIEKSPKIIGPLTLKQFMYIGTAGGICLILYLSVDFVWFILFGIILMPAAISLAFININGIPIPTIIKNFLFYSVAPRIYIWKKADLPLFKKVVQEKVIKKPELDSTPTLQIESNGRLKRLKSDIELRT